MTKGFIELCYESVGYDKVPHPKWSSNLPVTRFPTFALPQFTAATFKFSKNVKIHFVKVLNITRVVNVAFEGSKRE